MPHTGRVPLARALSKLGRSSRSEAVALIRAGQVSVGGRIVCDPVIELVEGKNGEIRRLCLAVGHEVTALKRVAFGGLELGSLAPGAWREVTRAEVQQRCGSAAELGLD
jgi:16S rRNA U516 pseudouridylate synthase RsuA-like enzyme